jgi:O-antigen/teichoic acid export membrane protein
LSVKDVGLYSAAAKLGGLLNVLQTVFGTAWQYFSYETMNNDNKEKIYSLFLEIIILLSSLLIIFIILFSDYLTSVIFPIEYYSIWIIIPILCFSPVCMVLMWIISVGSNFAKKTYLGLISVGTGALINILLNIIFIPIYGIFAASITTLISYLTMVAITYLLNRKILNIQINFLKNFSTFIVIIIIYLIKISYLELRIIGSIILLFTFILFLICINFSVVKILKTKLKNLKKD